MNTTEFSDRFDLLWNNIASNQAPGLNEWEKSIFLTKAQEEIVKNYFTEKGNSKQDGFDDSIKRQSDFSTLVDTQSYTMVSPSSGTYEDFVILASNKAKVVSIQDEIFLILNEEVSYTANGNSVLKVVVPISYQEYDRVMQKPYKYPPKNQVWRLCSGVITSNRVLEFIGVFPSGVTPSYKVRYVKRPAPIILTTLSDGLTVNGKSAVSECELPDHLHDEVLQRAVEIAKATWQGDVQSTIQIGQRSE